MKPSAFYSPNNPRIIEDVLHYLEFLPAVGNKPLIFLLSSFGLPTTILRALQQLESYNGCELWELTAQ